MEITKNVVNGNSLYVKPIGRIDVNTAAEFGTSINDDLDNMVELVIDFDEIVYISSIGLRVLLELQKRMKEQGNMKLIRVKPEIMEIFKMTGFHNILTIV